MADHMGSGHRAAALQRRPPRLACALIVYLIGCASPHVPPPALQPIASMPPAASPHAACASACQLAVDRCLSTLRAGGYDCGVYFPDCKECTGCPDSIHDEWNRCEREASECGAACDAQHPEGLEPHLALFPGVSLGPSPAPLASGVSIGAVTAETFTGAAPYFGETYFAAHRVSFFLLRPPTDGLRLIVGLEPLSAWEQGATVIEGSGRAFSRLFLAVENLTDTALVSSPVLRPLRISSRPRWLRVLLALLGIDVRSCPLCGHAARVRRPLDDAEPPAPTARDTS